MGLKLSQQAEADLIDDDKDALILRVRHAHEDWESDEA